jgi:hypothetical protein
MSRNRTHSMIEQGDLIPGQWYIGRGRYANIGLWTEAHFLTIGEDMGQPRIKQELCSAPGNDGWGSFQLFLALDDGDLLEGDTGSGARLCFPSDAGSAAVRLEWTLEGQARLRLSAQRVLGIERDRPVETPVHKIVSADHEE